MNKEKIQELAKEDKGIFSLCTKLKENGFKCDIVDICGNMFLKFDSPVFEDKNVICADSMAEDNAESVNNSLKWEVV